MGTAGLTGLVLADLFLGGWLVFWIAGNVIGEPYHCDLLCKAAGAVAAVGLAAALWLTAVLAREH